MLIGISVWMSTACLWRAASTAAKTIKIVKMPVFNNSKHARTIVPVRYVQCRHVDIILNAYIFIETNHLYHINYMSKSVVITLLSRKYFCRVKNFY